MMLVAAGAGAGAGGVGGGQPPASQLSLAHSALTKTNLSAALCSIVDIGTWNCECSVTEWHY